MTDSDGPAPRPSSGARSRTFRGLLDLAAAAGSVLLLVGVCAALGLAISVPLWAFATGARQAYTLAVLAAAAAGIAYLAVGAARRRRRAADLSLPRRSAAARLITVLMVVVGVCGAWAAAALLVRGLWILAAAAAVLWASLLWLLARVRAAARSRKAGQVPAENQGE